MTPRATQSAALREQAKLADMAVQWVRASDAKAEAKKRLQRARAAFYRQDDEERPLLIEFEIIYLEDSSARAIQWRYTRASDFPAGTDASADPIVIERDAAYAAWRSAGQSAATTLGMFRRLARRVGTTTIKGN